MTVDFTLNAYQRRLQSTSREFAREVLRGVGSRTDQLGTPEERFRATRPVYEKMVGAGFLSACIPRSFGGDNQSLIDTAVLIEELHAENASVALTLLGTVLGLQPIVVAGTEDQAERLLAPFLGGHGAPLAAFCSTEPGGSANASSPPPGEGVRTVARRDGDNWLVSGRKKWVSSATGWDNDSADLLCIVCRTDPDVAPAQGISIIAAEKPTGHVTLDRAIDSRGFRAHLLPEFTLRNVRVPRNNLIGLEGGGLNLSAESFAAAAALIGLVATALMRAAFDHALDFARTERRAGAVPIIEHQAVGYALADAKMSIEATRALSWRACCAVDDRHPAAQELANQGKIFASETAVRVITDLMRVVGVDSYDTINPLTGLLNDALALPVFAGGNMGVRRRALHSMLQSPTYDPLAAITTD